MKTNFSCGRTCAFRQACRFNTVFNALGARGKGYSHVTKVDVEIRDLDALETACKRLGLIFNRDRRTYRWYGRSVGDYKLPEGMTEKDLGQCSHAISVKDNARAYEVGLVDNHDGSYSPVWDFWNGGRGLQAAVGENCSKLAGEYTIEAARNAATAQGWVAQDNPEGTLTIYHPDGGTMTVSRDGTVNSDGFIGQGCSVASAIENALGVKQDTTLKAEFFVERARVKN